MFTKSFYMINRGVDSGVSFKYVIPTNKLSYESSPNGMMQQPLISGIPIYKQLFVGRTIDIIKIIGRSFSHLRINNK